MKRVAGKTQITYLYILYSFCCVLRALGIMLQKRRRRLQNGLKRNLIRGEPICWKITTPFSMIAQMGSSFSAVRLKRNMEIFSKSAFGPIYNRPPGYGLCSVRASNERSA